jgi:hypothetical protein
MHAMDAHRRRAREPCGADDTTVIRLSALRRSDVGKRTGGGGFKPSLPEVIGRYQDAHDRHETERALGTFAADARVVDEDREYRGPDQIRAWLATAATEFTYTRTLIDVEAIDGDKWLVVNNLEGNFPGGVVDLRYRFVLRDGLIAELIIAP